jgi:hypothetical protein
MKHKNVRNKQFVLMRILSRNRIMRSSNIHTVHQNVELLRMYFSNHRTLYKITQDWLSNPASCPITKFAASCIGDRVECMTMVRVTIVHNQVPKKHRHTWSKNQYYYYYPVFLATIPEDYKDVKAHVGRFKAVIKDPYALN